MTLSCYYAGDRFRKTPLREVAVLSQTAEYALRAVVQLARQPGTRPVQASDLAAGTGVPENYLRKVLHDLVRSGVLQSSRGKHGGFRLALPPEQITLLAVVARFSALAGPRACILGRAECSDAQPCALHHRWKGMADDLARFFGETTIADVARPPATQRR